MLRTEIVDACSSLQVFMFFLRLYGVFFSLLAVLAEVGVEFVLHYVEVCRLRIAWISLIGTDGLLQGVLSTERQWQRWPCTFVQT